VRDPEIIDIHCHTAGSGSGGSGCFVSSALRGNWRFRLYHRFFGVTEAELLREGDALIIRRLSETLAGSRRVAKAVVIAMDGIVDDYGELDLARTEIYIPNGFVVKETRRFPNLLFGASVNPLRPDALERLDKVADDGAVLIKWLPSIQHIDPSNKRLVPFYRRLSGLGLPLLTHTGKESTFTWARDELGDPERLRLPLEEGVTVIAAHGSSSGMSRGKKNFHRFLRLAKSHPNLHADISALTQVNRLGHLERILKHEELHSRLLYGSDMPLINTGITSPWFHIYRLSPAALWRVIREKNPWDRDIALKRELGVTEKIFENSARLLKLNDSSLS